MAKSYKDSTAKERYDSAIAADNEEWHPGTEIRKLVRSKLGMDNENMSKGVQLKLGAASKEKPTDLNPKVMKNGGKVKCMARGGGIEVRGKTKGRIC